MVCQRSSPCPAAKLCCLPAEHEAVLITLPIGNHNILKLIHDAFSTEVHQCQAAGVIWLDELMGICKPVDKNLSFNT